MSPTRLAWIVATEAGRAFMWALWHLCTTVVYETWYKMCAPLRRVGRAARYHRAMLAAYALGASVGLNLGLLAANVAAGGWV